MKDYKRLTGRNDDGAAYVQCADCYIQDKCILTKEICCNELQDRLADLEDKIESGELCDRKETAKEILKPLYNVIMEHSDCCVNLSEDIKFLMEKYGIDLENEE